jgi:hypothetical protein
MRSSSDRLVAATGEASEEELGQMFSASELDADSSRTDETLRRIARLRRCGLSEPVELSESSTSGSSSSSAVGLCLVRVDEWGCCLSAALLVAAAVAEQP